MFGFFGNGSSVSVQEAYENLGRDDSVLIDVRSAAEVAAQGVKGAVNVPLEKIQSAVPKLGGYKHVYLICRSGSRSGMAAQMLRSLGVPQAKNVEGGLIAWARAGLPVA